MPQKKILILVGDYVEDYEVMVPFQALQMVGHTVARGLSGQEGGRVGAHRDPRFRRRPDLQRKARATTSRSTRSSTDVNPRGLRALVIPGGRAPEYIRLNPRVLEIVRHFAAADKPIAAICHARNAGRSGSAQRQAAAVAIRPLVPDVVAAGGTYADMAIDKACVDGKLVSAPAWPAHPAWLAGVPEVLEKAGTQKSAS